MNGFLKNLFLSLISMGMSMAIASFSDWNGLGKPTYFEVLIFAVVFRIYLTSPNDPSK